jgi:hypothetical protein
LQEVLPSEEYLRRRKDRATLVAHHEKIHIRLGNIRLGIAVAAAILAWMALRGHTISYWWLAAPVVLYVGTASYHTRVLRERELAERAVAFYDRGLARMEDRWAGVGETGNRFADAHHVYSADLDLFGESSLFQLLSTARTRMGEDRLASWLLAPAPLDQIRERHAAIRELRDQLELREDLAGLGADAGVGVYPEALLKWAQSPNQMKPAWMSRLAPVLGALAVGGIIGWAGWGLATPFLLILIIEAAITYGLKNRVEDVLHETEHAFRNLDLLSGVMARVEAHRFQAPRLKALHRELLSSGMPGSRAIARLRALVNRIDARRNMYIRIIDAPLMYSVQVAFAAERWRAVHGSALQQWISAIAEVEALLSFAGYSYEHLADPFPEFVEGHALFEAEELGHPLIPATSCVHNTVSISGKVSVVLVSGSNMSGKSTLLRAVGLNAVLAMAGAPVRASRLRLTPLRVGASIRINDSLQEGSSRFYAEITRLRQILDAAGGDPSLLFLLDELLQGTNSSDRRVGSEGIVRALVERGAIGFVTTHDLALTEIAGALDGNLHNVHFRDEFVNGKITFDYHLRDGVVTKSNGLALMRSIGLDV